MDVENRRRLLEDFPSHTYEEWKAAAVQLLKGRPFEKTLVTPTYEGFDLQPVYMLEDLEKLPHAKDLPGMGSRVRGSRVAGYLEAGWKISQELTGPTVVDANAIAREYLAKGQTELNIRLDKATSTGIDVDAADPNTVGRMGVSITTKEDMKQLLQGLDLQAVSLYFQGRQAAPGLYALLMAALADMGVTASRLSGCLGMDPVGSLSENGTATSALEDVLDMLGDVLKHAASRAPGLQVIDVQGHAYHNGGASSVQEMAAVLSAAVLYLREMAKRGIPADEVIPYMRLSVSIGGNYFIEIAKLRALRLLWSRIAEAFGADPEKSAVHIHARTGLWNKTVLDPYVNMLRVTTEAFAAVVGGCDSLHVGPFDEVVRETTAFSRRIAFNLHDILAEECDMRRVVDPAGGSWAVESLTDKMAASAWERFQAIEANGGILDMLLSGKLQEQIEATRLEKARNIQRRRDLIVGTNAYPNASEALLSHGDIDHEGIRKQLIATAKAWKNSRDNASLFTVLDEQVGKKGGDRVDGMIKAAGKGATLHELQRCVGLGTLLEKARPIQQMRAASDFEALRIAAKELEQSGTLPLLHQLNMGPSRNYRIRADWTSAFFQAGGFKVLNDDDYDTVAEAIEALRSSGARLAVITSDDETYKAVVEDLASAIRQQLPEVSLYLAGAPGELEETWNAAGVDGYVHVRVNNYELNRQLLETLGASV